MTYKGNIGIAALDEEANLFTGEVVNTRDGITFQGRSVDQLKKAFKDSVDDYLDFCKSRNEEPEKPFSGTFTVRVPPAVHKQIAIEAGRAGKSLNSYVVERLRKPRRAPSPQ
jgi:predicted HicB family RNase H-like nuclease